VSKVSNPADTGHPCEGTSARWHVSRIDADGSPIGKEEFTARDDDARRH
jgi:hypothetical protein